MMKIFCILIMISKAYSAEYRWVDFQENTCIDVNTMSEYMPPSDIDGSLYSSTGLIKFLGLGKDDCKKKCAEYNMELYRTRAVYPCRAIEWSDTITTVCHLSFKMEHQTYDGISNSACEGWHVSIMWAQDIKGYRWRSDCILKMVNYHGHDLDERCDKANSYQECRKKCQDHVRCGFWTWVIDDPWTKDKYLSGACCLKDYGAALSIHDQPSSCTGVCLISGTNHCHSPWDNHGNRWE